MKKTMIVLLTLVLFLLASCSNMPSNPQNGSGGETQPGVTPQGSSNKATADIKAYLEVKEAKLEKVTVSRIVDGDTIEVNLNGKKEKIRLILVDTPETVAPGRPKGFFGTEAKDYTKSRLEGQTIWLEKDVQAKDQYQRLLRYVFLDVKNGKGEFFNGTLIRGGYARLATFPPNVKYVDQIRTWQTEARNANRGLWKNFADAFPDRKIEK